LKSFWLKTAQYFRSNHWPEKTGSDRDRKCFDKLDCPLGINPVAISTKSRPSPSLSQRERRKTLAVLTSSLKTKTITFQNHCIYLAAAPQPYSQAMLKYSSSGFRNLDHAAAELNFFEKLWEVESDAIPSIWHSGRDCGWRSKHSVFEINRG